MKRLFTCLAVLGVVSLWFGSFAPGPARAGALSELILQDALFAQAPAGSELRYSLQREVPPAEDAAGQAAPNAQAPMKLRPVVAGAVTLTAASEGERKMLVLRLDEGQGPREIAQLPTGSANPILLFFLENVVRHLAVETGGSPYYLRNRIRDAVVAADLPMTSDGAGGVVTVTVEPFAQDKNRSRMGALADLRLQFEIDPSEPSRIISLKADTSSADGGYSEAMVLIEAK